MHLVKLKVTVASATLTIAAFGASIASAATVTFDQNFSGSAYIFSYNDLDVTVTGWNYVHPTTVGALVTPTSPSDVVVGEQGLGVCENDAGSDDSCGNPQIDAVSTGGPELAVLSFSKAVTLSSISFNQNNNGDQVDFLTSVGTSFPLTYQETRTFSGGGPGSDTFVLSFASLQQLGVGIFSSANPSDQVRISGFTFECDGLTDCMDDDGNTGGPSPVPLPAGLPLLASALGFGLFLRKRRG